MPGWLQGETLAQEKASACPEEEPCLSGVEGTSEGRLHRAVLGERTAKEELGWRPVGRAEPAPGPPPTQGQAQVKGVRPERGCPQSPTPVLP